MLLLASVAAAAPDAKKRETPDEKKRVEIEKHEWMAQYYLRRANDMAGAAKEYQAILALDAENANAALALAAVYGRDGKDKQALEVLQKLVKKNAKSAPAWLALAERQAKAGDDKGLKESVGKAIAIEPRNVDAYELLFEHNLPRAKDGDATAKVEALEAARKMMLYARRQGPTYKLAERAIVELGGEPLALTIYDAKKAYAAAFENGTLGRINAQMKVAKSGFEECVKASPKNEECHYHLGLVYSSVKASDAYDATKALAELAQAPSLPMAWVATARLHRATDKNAEARAALTKAIALDDELGVAHVELGILDKVEGKVDAAIAHFVAVMDRDPFGPVADRALDELTKTRPTHPYVTRGMMMGKRSGDIFSSERFKSVVALIEKELGGVQEVPEKAVLEQIVQKLVDGSAIKQQFHVQVVGTTAVNAFALGDGSVYVTRGLLDLVKKKFPKMAIDANNDVLGHVLAHELQHVIRRHQLSSQLFQEAAKDASARLDPFVVTHVTRLHEIDADRQGMVMAFLAGYHPRGGIEFMEVMGQDNEIPAHLDHPTFEERVEYLSEYWTNDVRYAFVSLRLGLDAFDRGAKLESTDMKAAVAAYEDAVENFKRYRAMLPSLKEAMNDLGVAYTKIGVLAMAQGDTPLARWQTRFSIERDSAIKYVGLAREESTTRGAAPGGAAVRIPWQLREAMATFKEALGVEETYVKARVNLAAAYIAANQLTNATDTLDKIAPVDLARSGVVQGDIELVRGIALAEQRDYDRARAAFEKAIKSQAAKRAASYNLARTLELAGKKDEAKRAYQQYAKLYPGGPWAKAADTAAGKL
ncbi:MAG: tetratricopeptide repeat protein [Deltaproteobacteria bacterium]|nr:tetratricopeptide repeat protein [Deltaproteobacteria bacterium]